MRHGVAGPFVAWTGIGRQDKAVSPGIRPHTHCACVHRPRVLTGTLFSRIGPRSMIAIGIYAGCLALGACWSPCHQSPENRWLTTPSTSHWYDVAIHEKTFLRATRQFDHPIRYSSITNLRSIDTVNELQVMITKTYGTTLSACSQSAIMSSICSIPTAICNEPFISTYHHYTPYTRTRIRSSVTPVAARSSTVNCECVVDAG